MEIIGTKSSITLGTLALASVIASLHTLKAENMETLGKHCILFTHVTAGAGQPRLKKKKNQSLRNHKAHDLNGYKQKTRLLNFRKTALFSPKRTNHSLLAFV